MMDLPGRIRERRRALGLTQDQLADMLHVSRQTVSHWETGRVTPDLENLTQLAEALECSFVIGEKDIEPMIATLHRTKGDRFGAFMPLTMDDARAIYRSAL